MDKPTKMVFPLQAIETEDGAYLIDAHGVVVAESPHMEMKSDLARDRNRYNFGFIAQSLNAMFDRFSEVSYEV